MHHVEAFNHYWKDKTKTNQLKKDYSKLDLKEVDSALCDFAKKILIVCPNHNNEDSIENLKSLGLSDRVILGTTLVISYFNFVNRIVLGLGLAVNEEELKGYEYD